MEIHLMSSCLLLNSRLTPEASTTPQLVHSIGRRCLGTPLSLILGGFFLFFWGGGGWNLNCKKEIFCHKRSTNFRLSEENRQNGKRIKRKRVYTNDEVNFYQRIWIFLQLHTD